MVTRVSGTVSLAPQSGSVTSSATNGNITQNNGGTTNIIAPLVTFGTGTGGLVEFINSASNVGSYFNPTGAYYGKVGSPLENLHVDETQYSTTVERKLAGTYFAGGVGIEQDLSVGGFIYGRIAQANTSTTSTNISIVNTNTNDVFYPIFVNAEGLASHGATIYADNTNSDNVTGDGGLQYNPALGLLTTEQIHVDSTVTSTSTTSGALVVDGGVGISQDINIGGNIFPGVDDINSIGREDRTWASGYLQNVYTKFLGNTNSNITMSPNDGISNPNVGTGGIVDIFGDIRVRGQNPIGTAPVVTNVLYVTMDGDDTNDGRAQDASRACRTISGAVKSPYYQPGTQIRVSAGHYLENNPIQLKPYTSIMGSDLRTTGIEPINKTQDLFHMNSGCYLAFMQFLNGRSGLLPGNYAPGYNRGAYATAFPPLTGSDRIDLFHSPYIQNCTNLTGPWLVDGTMFVPDETVQIPVAVGTGTWAAGTSTIVVTLENMPINGFINAGPAGSNNTEYSGDLQNTLTIKGSVSHASSLTGITSPTLLDAYTATDTGALWVYTGAKNIEIGMNIVPGQQNQGFFNARSLMLANKPFLQWQVASYIQQQITANIANTSSIWYNFSTNLEISYRDSGILVENVAYDAAFGGNQKSIESGQSYWNGPVSYIASSLAQCTEAINYLETLIQKVIVNSTCTVLPAVAGIPVAPQVINFVLTGGSVASDSISSCFEIITTIANQGPDSAPTSYTSPGPDAAYVSAEILMQANRQFIQENTLNYINWNLVQPQPAGYLPYNQIKCARDAGIIVDSIAADLLYPTPSFSQTTFAGLQYYAQGGYTGNISTEITTTTKAISYLQQIAIKVIKNITAADDAIIGITRYSTATQITTIQPATASEVAILNTEFGIITSILNGNTTGWTDQVVANGSPSNLLSVQDAYNNLQANLNYMQQEVLAYITTGTNHGGLGFTNFTTATCIRDIGYIIDSVGFDLLHGGNRQAIQSGLSYYQQNGADVLIPGETNATSAAFAFLGSVIESLVTTTSYVPLQTKVPPVTNLPLAGVVPPRIASAISTLTNIITSGPAGYEFTPINITASTDTDVVKSYNIIEANRDFLVAETTAWINQTYNTGTFYYDQSYCYRDIGLMVDAVSQDIILGGNQRSIEAGLSYWNQDYNYIYNEISTTTAAISYIADICQQIIANQPVAVVTGTNTAQVINTFFQYGDNYMPQQAVARNFNIISTIIANGPRSAPPVYAGGGLFALTGINGADVKLSPTVTYVSTLSTGTYLIGLSEPTVGFGNNATLYFGDTYVWPLQDAQVDTLSLLQTGSKNTWNSRKVDAIGGMGGSLVDGAVISDRSPIQSFVYDAFTQLTQGGRGIHITNNGYAQLVSVFTIFSSVGVQVDNGGIASIVNSNANFGDLCLVAKGYGYRSFSGTVFNPAYRSYPFSPISVYGSNALDPYYPNGFWPNAQGQVEIFVPDLNNRPHISLVMEVVPPETVYDTVHNVYIPYTNALGFSGFLNAQPSTGTLVAGTIALENIDTTDVYVGNTLHILDQFGKPYDSFQYIHDEFGNYVDGSGNILANQVPGSPGFSGIVNPSYGAWYAATGTTVVDINFNSIVLNQALTGGGGFADDNTYFTLYFCGNAYYTVQTSSIANSPYAPNTNILSTNTNALYQGPSTSQVVPHVASINHLNTIVDQIIKNVSVTPTAGNTATQTLLPTITGGNGAQAFIDLRFGYLTSIIGSANINAAESVVPSADITKTGTIPSGAGSAITLIQANIDFMASEVYAYVLSNYPTLLNTSNYQYGKCRRDVGLILQQLIYDLETGGNYNMVYAGLSYWSRPGTYHIVELGEAVTDPTLFPDGAIVNFYQRSYISASGYVFEYVGAGSNYGALPQNGIADPIQKQETIQLNSGKVFFTSTDQNGDFRIGTNLVISQATGVISGRVFTQSLFANMTPFILAIEGL